MDVPQIINMEKNDNNKTSMIHSLASSKYNTLALGLVLE